MSLTVEPPSAAAAQPAAQPAAEPAAQPAAGPPPTDAGWACVDGNEAAARVAHKLSDVCAIYPITPASPMGELADVFTAQGRTNLWGQVPAVIEMQSEGGAAGTLHGAVQAGALASTFTSSQGLLLILPNMFKIAGELTPAVLHVAARAIATHALSIFGDHSDVMAARSTGWAMLGAADVQEAHDFAAISHAATVSCRVPFLHFFDGFRTSHEVARIRLLDDAVLRALVDEDAVRAHRARALSPAHPVLRGTAQNPDVFFQGREAGNRFYDAVPATVQGLFDRFAALTGRQYSLVDYHGAPDATRVVVLMGSGVGTVKETVDHLVASGEKVGVLVVRLYRPFPAAELAAALPATVTDLAVLDRVKEPGATAEPLHLDVVTALTEHWSADLGRPLPRIIGGRYGLGSKEFTPRDVKAVFDELAQAAPKRRFTVGIVDDVTFLSLRTDPEFRLPSDAVQAVFWGLGSDGTVGANKASVKLIGEHAGLFSQGYFVYDSKKSGSTTTSHLRFGPTPIASTYLVEQADFVAVHQFSFVDRLPVLDVAAPGATVLLNAPYPAEEVWEHLSDAFRAAVIDKSLTLWSVDAASVAKGAGLGKRINTVMQACFFALSEVLPTEQALALVKASAEKSYAKRGPAVVAANLAAIDAALAGLHRVEVPAGAVAPLVVAPRRAWEAGGDAATLPEDVFVERITKRLIANEGELLPVSAMPPGGTFPTGTAKHEKRGLAEELPSWDASLCIDCGKCTLACPHAAIRMKAYPEAALEGAPEGFASKPTMGRDFPAGTRLTIQIAPDDCTGCGICVQVCPAKAKAGSGAPEGHKSLDLVPAQQVREAARPGFEFFLTIPEADRTALRVDTVKGSQLLQPLFEFSGACTGCGETPYLKLLSQLMGDRMVIANATGCSSIFGGNLPTTPWTRNAAGRGPAWNNSLFEDNAEFGLGLQIGAVTQAEQARSLLTELAPSLLGAAARAGLDAGVVDALLTETVSVVDEAGIAAQQARVEALKPVLSALAAAGDARAASLQPIVDALVPTSVWVVGGDGWAYDIGFGGLDHLLASGRNINVLVLDTEVYSNTGGQSSKSTPRGAAAKFAASGKTTRKKDLGLLAQAYRDVYVAQIAIGANEPQTVRALLEAAAYDGPSLILAYSTCLQQGVEMTTSMGHQKSAVASGHWPLYRYHPEPEPGAQPQFKLDSKAPSMPFAEFAATETRYSSVARANPEHAAELMEQAQTDVDERWARYRYLADQGQTDQG
ncbi:MAG: pyruvate:ferredoxin (flavodoxin) oxidoreductase [Kineosporiaceae bacterium]